MSTLGERIRLVREDKKLQQKELAELIDVKSAGVISNWERDLNKPDAEKIIKLCEVLKVSVSYLLDYYGSSGFETTLSEQDHIKKYRALEAHGKEMVDMVLNKEYDFITEKRRIDTEHAEETLIPFTYSKPEYLTGLSAGTGLFVFDDIPTQIIKVSEEYKNADFVIGVSGNSMEPTYCDGDKVAVKKMNNINVGDIGVFMINGNGYIKELGEGVLISHNKKFRNIQIDESMICIGKVLGRI